MPGQQTTLTFGGDAAALQRAAQKARQAVAEVATAVDETSSEMSAGAAEAQQYTSRVSRIADVSTGVSTAIGDLGGSFQAVADIQNMAKDKAAALARATAAVEQAMLDGKQAATDYKRAVNDFGQASVDAEQAQLNIEKAQKDYNDAVKEYGPASMEARQAAIDMKNEQVALEAAHLDAEDAINAQSQAQRDAKDSALDLADAQREAHPSSMDSAAKDLQAYAGVASGVAGTIGLLAMAYEALNLSTLKATAAQVGAKIATMASSVATGIATAAQWLWNVALSANPIGIVILAVAALVGVIILIATKTTWFQDLWRAAWGGIKAAAGAVWGWLKDTASSVWGFLTGLPEKLKSAFSKVTSFITAPFKAAFNTVSDAWNNTIGRMSWTVPGWVPGLGGKTISAPKLPHFHSGGVVPGPPGAEVLAVLQAGETVTPAGGGGPVQVIIRGDGSRTAELLLALLRDAISVRGGAVQTVLGATI